MTKRQRRARLRAKFEAARSAWLTTKAHKWFVEMGRLNLALLRTSRPVRG